MGMRGLRYSLIERDFFDEQVKAILRVSPNSQVRVLLPMVIDANDFLLAKQRIAELAGYLNISSLPKIGAMIETPSAIFQSDNIAAEADFLSIGTNDLAQFTLAADRQSSAMSDSYFALHPAVLKAIQVVLDAASAHDREVCICGEVAGDPASACILVGLGIRNLSMSPVRASRVRLAIRGHNSQELKQAAEEASRARSVDDVKQLLHGLL
jgi:phosphoenolpyruvate-protein kinase (PTS system EI component)